MFNTHPEAMGPIDVHGQAGSCLSAIGQAAGQYQNVSGKQRNALIAPLALEQPLFDPERELLWLLPRVGFRRDLRQVRFGGVNARS